MYRLFWGLFFVLLDWKITLGTAVIEIFPDFLGFYLLMKGMEELAGKSRFFNKGRHWSFGLALASGVCFGAELMDPDTGTKVFLWMLGFVLVLIGLALIRNLLKGCRDMGMDTETLGGMWWILAVLQSICYLANWIPLVGKVCDLVSVGTGALFLVAYMITTKRSAE